MKLGKIEKKVLLTLLRYGGLRSRLLRLRICPTGYDVNFSSKVSQARKTLIKKGLIEDPIYEEIMLTTKGREITSNVRNKIKQSIIDSEQYIKEWSKLVK